MALGSLLIVLGTTAIGSSVFLTLATLALVGWLMIAGGIDMIFNGWPLVMLGFAAKNRPTADTQA